MGVTVNWLTVTMATNVMGYGIKFHPLEQLLCQFWCRNLHCQRDIILPFDKPRRKSIQSIQPFLSQGKITNLILVAMVLTNAKEQCFNFPDLKTKPTKSTLRISRKEWTQANRSIGFIIMVRSYKMSFKMNFWNCFLLHNLDVMTSWTDRPRVGQSSFYNHTMSKGKLFMKYFGHDLIDFLCFYNKPSITSLCLARFRRGEYDRKIHWGIYGVRNHHATGEHIYIIH